MRRHAPNLDSGIEDAAELVASLQAEIKRLSAQVQDYQLMSLAAQHTDNAVVMTDQHGCIDWCNEAFFKLTGFTQVETRGRELASFFQQAHNDSFAQLIRAQLKRGLALNQELRLPRAGMAETWVQVSIKPIRSQGGLESRHMAILRDITVKRRMEKRLTLHHAVLDLLAGAQGVDDVLEPLIQHMATLLGCQIGLAWEVRAQRWSRDASLAMRAAWSQHLSQFGTFMRIVETRPCHLALPAGDEGGVSRHIMYHNDLSAVLDPIRHQEALRAGLQSVLVVPVIAAQQVLYLFELFSDQPEAPEPETIHLLESVTIQLAQFVTRKSDETRVRQFMREFDCLFKLSPDGFVVFDAQGIRSYGNPAFYVMTGLTRERLDGVSEAEFDDILASLCSADHQPSRIAELQKSGGSDCLRLQIPRPAILARSVRDMTDAEGRNIGRALYLRDITKEVESDRIKGEFLTTAAHELRTPVVSLLGYSELLMKREFSAERLRDIYETMNRQSSLLVKMVNELLDLSNIDARAGKGLHIQALALAPLVDSAIQACDNLTQTHDLQVALPGGGTRVFADEAYFTRALGNVLRNAQQFSLPGTGIRLDLLERAGVNSPQVGVRVTDQGMGMTAEQVGRVCERFYRADPSGNVPGTGLGMSLVKEVMNLMGGSVEITSELGRGTEVTLWFAVVTGAYRD